MPNDTDAVALAAAYEAGATLEELAAEIGRSYHYVRDSVLGEGVTLRPSKVRLPPLPAGMVAMYENGASIRQVGAHFGHSYCQTRRMLLDAGVTLRARGAVPYMIQEGGRQH